MSPIDNANTKASNSTPVERAIQEVEQSRHPQPRRFHFGSGAALVLIALIIISLLCFAALSIVSAQSDQKLTDRYAQQVSAYYSAKNRSIRYEAQLQEQLTELVTMSKDEDDYYTSASQLDSCVDPQDESGQWYSQIQNILTLEFSKDQSKKEQQKGVENAPIFVFSTPVNSNQTYLLVLRACYPAREDDLCYTILSAKTVTTAVVNYDTTLDVLQR